jgi:SAM-dependent methyltransferase
VPPGGIVIDVCCGSAPTRAHLTPKTYVGMDLSAAELRRAVGVPVILADAACLPVATGSCDAVVMSMALQLVPFAAVLAEVARVLRPGGVLVATVPVNVPLPAGDWLRYGRLSVALRHRLSYPNDAELASFVGTADLSVISDESRAFTVDVTTAARADLLLDALYLPGVSDERVAAGRKVVTKWVGHQVAVPIRRLALSRV